MRKKVVAGNWKCNTTLQEGIELAKAVNELVVNQGANDVVVVLGTPFTHITSVVNAVDASRIGVASQNCAAEAKGAFTGEVSAAMVKSTGAGYVIIGHSERREYYGETSAILNKKVALTLENGLTPIYCCGEALDIRESGTQKAFVINQLEETIFQLPVDEFKKIIIATNQSGRSEPAKLLLQNKHRRCTKTSAMPLLQNSATMLHKKSQFCMVVAVMQRMPTNYSQILMLMAV
jgi:triosephosphate isomerase (TIM)